MDVRLHGEPPTHLVFSGDLGRWNRPILRDPECVSEADVLRNLEALGKGSSLIITGDFNSGEASEPYQALFAPMNDKASPVIDTYRTVQPEREKNEGTGNGFVAKQTGGARIDWIACSREWQVRAAAIDRTAREGRTPSDHFAVTAVLGRE